MTRGALVVVLAACGGGGGGGADLEGMWRVDRVAAAPEGACSPDEDVADHVPFLWFHEELFAGQTILAYDGCPDATGVGCAPIGGVIGGFDEGIEGGWRGVTLTASGDAAACALGFDERTAVIDREIMTGLVIDHHTYREEGPVSGGPCDSAEAERRGAEMPCVAHDVVDATRL